MILTPIDDLADLRFSNKWKVFLAGPIQGAPEWQFTVPEEENIIWLSPRRKNYKDFDYTEQVDWETEMMNIADVILFWIPEEAEHVEGRQYAQTTRTEFGEYLALGKKIVFGCYKDFPGKRYFEAKMLQYGLYDSNQDLDTSSAYLSLEDCVTSVKKYIKRCEENPKIYFTSDTHFGDERALELSKRPFRTVSEMDRVMMRNWNNTVHPCDNIFHLGDFGRDSTVALKLNGTIMFVYGNYERDGKYKIDPMDFATVSSFPMEIMLNNKLYYLTHEPLTARNSKNKELYGRIFGHIHGRQKIKNWQGVDVGVDGNNYTPVSFEDVNFYLNAIEKGYYDDEVWS